jgi:hypothetical protein
LLQFCEEADIHFLSDEIYALSTFGSLDAAQAGPNRWGGKAFESPSDCFVSVLSRDLRGLGVDGARVHVLYSISKDLGCSGLRLVRPSIPPFSSQHTAYTTYKTNAKRRAASSRNPTRPCAYRKASSTTPASAPSPLPPSPRC